MTFYATGAGLANREGVAGLDITWPWSESELTPGLTAVVRVKNEARSLPFVLPGLLDASDRVVLVDNQSEDGTVEVAEAAAERAGAAAKLDVFSYPVTVSRCGPEHLHTPANSVHSLAYFYNWCFAQAHTTYSLKWDGDMVMTREGVRTFADLAWQLRDDRTVITMPRHPLYVEADGTVAYLDIGLSNIEPYVFPTGPEYTFVKAFEWEMRMHPDDAVKMLLPQGLCVELKWLDGDEFSHWTDNDSFAYSARTARKRREYETFHALARGEWEGLEGVIRIETPDDRHVVDYVTQEWLPHQPRPLHA